MHIDKEVIIFQFYVVLITLYFLACHGRVRQDDYFEKQKLQELLLNWSICLNIFMYVYMFY